ncbi:hypothetical protein CBR_g39053 [Chara braunii]|uniref:CCHC-type domain-containing protein n=1 Tax=Chara braunii TaxID=69332 RepID=A0A388LQR3_CHABU|nr:hypothetical protein CBR_g39053 [Chara braunii]|eukprot:GBG84678.1 hypothetical protein CBR_g39053 [Chara braunii]
MADGGRRLVTFDDLIDALDKRALSNVPKVETFNFKGKRVSDWLDLTEQALVGLSDEVKLQWVLRYVLHSHHREVSKVVDAANDSWTRFGDLMQRKYRLGDDLLTMTDLEAMNKEDFSTIGAFVHGFKKKARKVHEISEEAQCATFLGLLTCSEATELAKYGEGSERLTWATTDKGMEEGSLNQVEQHQMRLQRRKRKERDATASRTPGVKRIVTDVLAALGYDNEAEIQKKWVIVAQGRASGQWMRRLGRKTTAEGRRASQASVAGGGSQGQGGQGNGGRGQGGRGGGGRGRGGNGGGRGGGWSGQGGHNQGGQGSQEGGQGYGRPRFDWRNATCWHCGEVGHIVRFCQQRRDDELAGLISSCMDGDIYDRWGKHIDPKTPGGIRQEALRRAAAGPPAAPAMFKIWQERGDQGVRVEEIVDESEEVTQQLEHYMLSQGIAREEWVHALLIWTRGAERPVARQIRKRARDWEDCQAQLRRAFGRPERERLEPRVERRRRSKRPREPAPREVGLTIEKRRAPTQREDEPAGPAPEEESFPVCGLRAVEFRWITSEELRPPSPLPSGQEMNIPGETPFRNLATHLDVSQWEASRLGEGSVEPTRYVPLDEPLDPETETNVRDRAEPQDPEVAPEQPDSVRPQAGEVITVGDDTPPCSPVPEPAQHSWPEGIPEPGSEEIPEFPPEATAMPEQEAETEVIEEPAPTELPSALPCTSERMGTEASTPEGQGPRVRRGSRETREEKSARVRVRLDEIHARQAEMEAAGIEPTPSVDPKTSEQRIDELWGRYESQRDMARQRSREMGQADEEAGKLREMGELGFSATRMAIERVDRKICERTVTSFQWYSLLNDEFRVRELEVEHLTTQLAEERAGSQAREVEWERGFGEMAAIVDRLSAAWKASQAGRAGADDQGRGMQASPNQGAAVETPRQAGPMGEVSLDTAKEEGDAHESLMAMSTERRGSRLHELTTAMGIGTPQERPQKLDTVGYTPGLGELRAELGFWATETDSGGPDSGRQ